MEMKEEREVEGGREEGKIISGDRSRSRERKRGK